MPNIENMITIWKKRHELFSIIHLAENRFFFVITLNGIVYSLISQSYLTKKKHFFFLVFFFFLTFSDDVLHFLNYGMNQMIVQFCISELPLSSISIFSIVKRSFWWQFFYSSIKLVFKNIQKITSSDTEDRTL